MKKILVLFIFLPILTSISSASKIEFDFKDDFVQIRFNKIHISKISTNTKRKIITLNSNSNLDKDFKVIDYKIIKTINVRNNSIKIKLRKNRNYIFTNRSLVIYYDFPQNGLITNEIVEVYKKPQSNSEKITEVLLGTIVEVTEEKDDLLKVKIPEQNGYTGWIIKDNVDLLIKHKVDSEYERIVSSKWVYLKTLNGRIKLSAGTKYKIIQRKSSKFKIELPTGLTGWIKKDNRNFKKGNYTKDISGIRKKITNTSKNFLGVPYKWGGTSYRGLDCSGFVYLVFKINGIQLPRDSSPQYKYSQNIELRNLKMGDLVFFQTYRRGPSHVGIYLGTNRFIHASSKKGVTISNLKENYYQNKIYGAGRVIKRKD